LQVDGFWIEYLVVQKGKIISSSRDEIRIWDLHTRKPIGKPLQGLSPRPNNLVVYEGKIIRAAGHEIGIWDLHTRKPMNYLLHKDMITHLMVQEGRIISCSFDGEIRIWDLYTGTPLGEPLQEPRDIPIYESQVIKHLIIKEGNIISVSKQNEIRIWDLHTGKSLNEPLQGNGNPITILEFHQGKIISGSSDGQIRIWDTVNKNSILYEADGSITCMLIAGNQVVAGDSLGKIHFLEPVGFNL
jgi:WD40 repeat protein